MQLHEGTFLVGGRYKIVRFISQGGFGCTYEGFDTSMNARVAIKEFFISEYCNRDEQSGRVSVFSKGQQSMIHKLRSRFSDEASAVFNMNHPNIVRVFNTFEENGTAYYVMEYIDGMSLHAMVDQNGPIPEQIAVNYIRQICSALQYVHSCNRLHLDVKPANIMVDRNGRAILIDFGASKHYDEETHEQTSSLLGINTPGYAPAEQMSRSFTNFSASTDIYALGATLYKLITGITPPDAIRLVTNEEELSLPQHISPAVRNAIYAAMQPIRTNRPQSIEQFVKILDGNTAKQTPTPPNIPIPPKANKSTKRPTPPVAESTEMGRNIPLPPGGRIPNPPAKPEKKSSAWKWIVGILIVLILGGTGTYLALTYMDSSSSQKRSALSNPVEDTSKSKQVSAQESRAITPKEETKYEEPQKADYSDLSYGRMYTLDGSLTRDGNSYPIVMYLTFNSDGSVSGKYAYYLTLNKYGDGPNSYFRVQGTRYGHNIDLISYDPTNPDDPFENISVTYSTNSNGDLSLNGGLTNLEKGSKYGFNVREVYK